MGQHNEIKIDINKISSGEYDSFLLCSDGFWEYVLEDEMCTALKEAADAEQWLSIMRNILKLRISSGNDNNTAVAIIVKD